MIIVLDFACRVVESGTNWGIACGGNVSKGKKGHFVEICVFKMGLPIHVDFG